MSAQHLNRLFHRTLGTTPLRYLGRLPMERAAVLLREGRLTISEISRRVGFRDPDHFSRRFSREFVRSPASYRQLYGQGAPGQGGSRRAGYLRSRSRPS